MVSGGGFCERRRRAVRAWYMCSLTRRFGAVLHSEPCTRVGRCFENGCGVAKDVKQAVEWYQNAADQNHPAAQYNLGPDHSSHFLYIVFSFLSVLTPSS